jgi:hypothetical protein
MRRFSWGGLTVIGAACCLGGCNAVLGINQPGDLDAGSVIEIPSSTGTMGRDATTGGGSQGTEAGPSAAFAFADWPMPNPPSTGLPNPQSYETGGTPGVVLDNVTGLEWQRAVDDRTLAWADAASYCTGLPLAGGGFRLPSRIELLSIVDFTRDGPVIDPAVFPNTPSEPFWSGSAFIDDPANAWSVHFGFATIFASSSRANLAFRARCVRRTATAVDRYTVQAATVLDTKTKLVWQRDVSATPLAWSDARTYCTDLALDGGGWRLPSVGELQTVVDETRSGPAVDPKAFPSTPSDYFWTSSPLPRFESFAWTVYFGYGLSTFFDVAQPHLVRCVR